MENNWGIIGHQHIVNYLKKSIKQNRLAHAYLFYGIKGVGKTTVAEIFADKIINSGGFGRTELYPLKVEEGKKDISIEQVREWRRSLYLKSFSSGNYKVGIIYEAEKLNRQSANALLKTIEEPAEKTVIIIITSDWEKLLETIISRSLTIRFLPLPAKEIFQALEKTVASKKKLEQIVGLSAGRPAVAYKLASDEKLLETYGKFNNLILKLFKVDIHNRWQVASGILDHIKDSKSKTAAVGNFLDHFEMTVRNLLLKNFDINFSAAEAGVNINSRGALKLLKMAAQARSDLQGNLQPKLVLENLFINL